MTRPKREKKKKLPPGITEEFIDRVANLDAKGRETLIVEIQKGIEEADCFLKTNEGVLEAKARYDECTASARETKKHLANRNKFTLDQMKLLGEI